MTIRAVLDTNILVSAFIKPEGTQHQIIRSAAKCEFRLILSLTILEELNLVLRYPRIQKKYRYTSQQIMAYITYLAALGEITAGNLRLNVVEKDPKDDMVIAAGVEGNADYIVSGDPHLKDIKQYNEIRIISPGEFIRILRDIKNNNKQFLFTTAK